MSKFSIYKRFSGLQSKPSTFKMKNTAATVVNLLLQMPLIPYYSYTQWNVLQIRYAEHLPSVLKNINCTFPGRKKVGVVGRTGSGKSTLIQAIFRIVEAKEGSILIDNVDISKIGLQDLRSRLSIIPQDPTMFEGTVRGNLDPLEQYSDHEVWEVIIVDEYYILMVICEKKHQITNMQNF